MHDPRGHYLETYCEIDLSAFGRNLEKIKKWSGGLEIILAVKANAYGHGVVPICREALLHGVERFGIATLVEGVELCDAGIRGEKIILTPPTLEQIPSVVYHDLSPNVVSIEFAEALSREALKNGKIAKIHLEIDTGMGRTGIMPDDAIDAINKISNLPGIKIEGIFSHFPAADSDEPQDIEFTKIQIEKFRGIISALNERRVRIPIVHISNSAGLLKYEPFGNAIRPGILAYGLYPSEKMQKSIDVEPVLSLRTKVVQIRNLGKGCSIGYGRTFTTTRPMRIAVIRAGYGDGLRRALSNCGEVLIRGNRCPILGRVSMDTTMVEVDENVCLDDEVIIIGEQQHEKITADDHAMWTNTLNYEILTGISERVRRVYVKDGKVVGISPSPHQA